MLILFIMWFYLLSRLFFLTLSTLFIISEGWSGLFLQFGQFVYCVCSCCISHLIWCLYSITDS